MESTRLSEKWKLSFSRASKRRRIRRREMRSWSSGRGRLDSWRGFQWIDLRREERRGRNWRVPEHWDLSLLDLSIIATESAMFWPFRSSKEETAFL